MPLSVSVPTSVPASVPPPPLSSASLGGTDPQPQPQSRASPRPSQSPPVSPHANSNHAAVAAVPDSSLPATSFVRRSSSSSSHSHSSAKQKSASSASIYPASTLKSFSSAATKRDSVVFVDPDDSQAPWWWPAIVVPRKEFQEFRKTTANTLFATLKMDLCNSTIPESDAMPFNPNLPPYTTYLHGSNGRRFKEDNAVRLATEYWEKGIPPASFGWLHGIIPLSLPIGAPVSTIKRDAASVPGTFGATKKARSQQVHPDSITNKKGSSNRNLDQQLHQQSNSKKSKREATSGINGLTTAMGDSKNRKISSSTISTNTSNNRLKHNGGTEALISQRKTTGSRTVVDRNTDKQRESSSAELSPGPSYSQKESESVPPGFVKRNSKADIILGASKSLSHKSVPQQPYRRNGQQPQQQQSQQQHIGSQIIVGSNFSPSLCGVCGKPIGTCNCSLSQYQQYQVQQQQQQHILHFNPSNGIQFQTQQPQLQQQQTIHQLHNRYLGAANLDQQIVYQNHQQRVFLNQSGGHLQSAPTASPSVANPFAPICVLKRNERPEAVIRRGKFEDSESANLGKIARDVEMTASAAILTYNMGAHERPCFYTDSRYVEEKLSVYFAVQAGGEFDIDYEVTAPDGALVMSGNKEQSGDYVFSAPQVGEFKFCFFNTIASFAEKKFDFEILSQHEIPTRNNQKEKDLKFEKPSSEDAISKLDVTPVQSSIQTMHNHFGSIIRDLRYFRTRENRNFDTVRSTENRIFWFNIVQNGIILVTAVVQVVVLQFLFSKAGSGGIAASYSSGSSRVSKGGFSASGGYGPKSAAGGYNGDNTYDGNSYGSSANSYGNSTAAAYGGSGSSANMYAGNSYAGNSYGNAGPTPSYGGAAGSPTYGAGSGYSDTGNVSAFGSGGSTIHPYGGASDPRKRF
ncbi:hypothetical protein HK100_000500 [Physocladia obscura]|uniref:GOLD domain-containing protein n=1 Tax=Physocladia obscura TaxID=109957 RepID=A0AAD5XLR8_9FUNG|nr:hypothetical protein HK100_000500 [Physocladia obscura]